ncbi:CoA transferase [Streptomyces pilosus]|uniref:CaiB/BaiF CoA transferase family protein n=1 Tax=Streptomyces pilosus TaxID=28893 RepID=UPI00167569AE|nr:CoA transferase [Streptomyces pilosus]GGV45993.1 CoA transferase [Streptomyces pilosus]
MTTPLSGLRVLDLSTTFSGPYCGQLLADLGADVVKVEAPGLDVTRSLGTIRTPGLASVFVGANHGKSSVVLDLKAEDDYDFFLRLVSAGDVVLHNMRSRAAERLRIDYPTLRETAPHLVYAAISGYGSNGPYASRPAYDDTIQAMSGLAWLQSRQASRPTYMATPLADKTAGMMAALAVLAAVLHKTRTGVGQMVEIPMFETLASWTLMEQLGGRAFLPEEGPTGYDRLLHRRPHATRDGLVAVVVYHDGHWRRFLDHAGMGELLEDERFSTVAARMRHIEELYGRLGAFVAERTTEECLALFEKLDIPATELLSTDQLFEDPHLRAVGLFREMHHTREGSFRATRSPLLFSETPTADPAGMAPPQLPGEGEPWARAWLDAPRPWNTSGRPGPRMDTPPEGVPNPR